MKIDMGFLNKEWHAMTDAEIIASHEHWSKMVEGAPGWPSAYFAAKQLEQCQRESDKRGLGLKNPHPRNPPQAREGEVR